MKWTTILAIFCLTFLGAFSVKFGITGTELMTIIIAIAGLGGYELSKRNSVKP